MPLCRIIFERRRTPTHNPRIPVPVVYPPPQPVYPPPGIQYTQCTHPEMQLIVAAPQEENPEPRPGILNINIDQAASEIAENLAKENMLRNQVAVLESSLDEERKARGEEESARYQREMEEILEAQESRRRSRSRGEHRMLGHREVSVEHKEEEARRRISREYHHGRSSSLSRLHLPRESRDRLVVVSERSNPRHSADRLVVTHTHTRHHSHEIIYHRCSICDQHGHGSSECPESRSEVVEPPVRRVRYWQM